MENLVVPGCGRVSACNIEYGILPPPEQASQDDHPGSCSMLERVIAFRFALCSEAEVELGAPVVIDEVFEG